MDDNRSSRLLIKNLPINLDVKRAERLISEKCKELNLSFTDCKLLMKPSNDGKSEKFRGLCFIGFMNSEESTKFKNYYDGTYFNACKVTIEYAKPPSQEKHKPQGPKRRLPSDTNGDDTSNGNVDEAELDRVVIFNLAYNVTEEEITKFCESFGPLVNVHLPMESNTQTSSRLNKGYCFVTFMFPSDAYKFCEAKNRSIFNGRIVHAQLAKPKENLENENELTFDEISRRMLANSSYKKTLAVKKVKESQNCDIWNLLHVDINAAVSTVATNLKLDRRDLLGDEDAAVNAAIAETNILGELTQWLEFQGVDVSVRGHPSTRSNDTIIIKNISSKIQEADILAEFSKFGTLVRFSLSPHNLMGIAQYLLESNARTAFTGLAYKCIAGAPLYLEWAPLGLFKSDAKPPTLLLSHNEPEQLVEEETVTTPSTGTSLHCSIYLKNLNFGTRKEDLERHFSCCNGYISSTVVLKDGGTLSTGFGFVEFDTIEAAKDAIRAKSGLVIDGRSIEMSISDANVKATKPTLGSGTKRRQLQATQKLVVKNLAFQATPNELKRLFGQYGNVKSVRIPKKIDGKHRGFAFVEYLTRQESAHALEALSNTHLYGRRLVLEFSNEIDEATTHLNEGAPKLQDS
ncbi:bifunctional RNA-binding domain superfamily/Nucleotide-binding alpha-beta plait domain superfamily/RNA recognition motif domain [Babesia duncani]|uniref:Bifunctional RNA-binding domain superfamily/Nucleotide-binding alpha-beta plait domain superfamily/RNA recognition motif domain n=1 Tax=Babesia duncani TaxID=323732 RepID=A0AAD9PPJ4_9APIC|nr:bifunctional RNA-binding domain superfamily/Nucleotide-binding alpha-beta plait domain superfamily/RNA recognition motif domain [Babesia duncani]